VLEVLSLVFKAHILCVSLDSTLENKKEDKEDAHSGDCGGCQDAGSAVFLQGRFEPSLDV